MNDNKKISSNIGGDTVCLINKIGKNEINIIFSNNKISFDFLVRVIVNNRSKEMLIKVTEDIVKQAKKTMLIYPSIYYNVDLDILNEFVLKNI